MPDGTTSTSAEVANHRPDSGDALSPKNANSEVQAAPSTELIGLQTPVKSPACLSSMLNTPRHLQGVDYVHTPEHVLLMDFDNEWELDVCAVCLGQVESLDEAGRLPCKCMAVYHRDCVARWLLRNDSCPQCRHPADAAVNITSPDCAASNTCSAMQHCGSFRKTGGRKSIQGGWALNLEDVAMMYLCKAPFQQAAAAMNMPADGCCGTDPDKHTAEIWMILHDSRSAVVAVNRPATTEHGRKSLGRALIALKGSWMYPHGPSFITMFHPECILQSHEYTASTGVIWRIMGTLDPPVEPPYIVKRVFMTYVKLHQATQQFGRWLRCFTAGRGIAYLSVVLLIMLSLLLGLHQICAVATNGTRCTWSYHESLVRGALLYTGY